MLDAVAISSCKGVFVYYCVMGGRRGLGLVNEDPVAKAWQLAGSCDVVRAAANVRT
jgi:hypothetical protein